MTAQQVDPEAVIARLANQIGQLSAQMAMQGAALEAAQQRIQELEAEPDDAQEATP